MTSSPERPPPVHQRPPRTVFQPGLFVDKVVFCTGGRSGICRAIVDKLLGLGASVTIVGRNAELNSLAAKELSTPPPTSSDTHGAIDDPDGNDRPASHGDNDSTGGPRSNGNGNGQVVVSSPNGSLSRSPGPRQGRQGGAGGIVAAPIRPRRRCLAQTADVRKPAELERAVRATVEAFGGIDFVVCGAAGNFLAPIEGLSTNAFRTVIDIDLMGTFNTVKATLAEVKKRQGAFLSISATLHYQGVPYQAHVSAAKAAVDALSQVLAVELGPVGVRSNIVAPGPIANTEGMGRLSQGKPFDAAVEIPLGRQGEPAEIASMCAFLLSDEARWITGQVFVVDGGARHTQTGLVPYPSAVLEPVKFLNGSSSGGGGGGRNDGADADQAKTKIKAKL